jgi:hypothetical protein
MTMYERRGVAAPAVQKRIYSSWIKALAAFCAAVVVVSGSAYALSHTPLSAALDGEAAVSVGPGDSDVDVEPVENYYFVDKNEYDGVLLGKTEDAGKSYIEDTLFIGDSNTLRMYMFQMLPLSNVIGVESMGVSGAKSHRAVHFIGYSSPVTIAEAVGMMKPRRAVICFGTNDLATANPQSFVNTYKEFIKDVQSAYSYTDIIIAAVPPFARELEGRSFSKNTVAAYNKALIEMAKELELVFLDTGEALTGMDGFIKTEYIFSDGIHLTKAGFEAIFKYARTHSHIVDDLRPKPIGKIPEQYLVVKEPEKPKDPFDPYAAASVALGLLETAGFEAAPSNTVFSVNLSFTVPFAEAKAGNEQAIGQNLYNYVLAQTGITSGYIAISAYADTPAEIYVFKVSIDPHNVHTFEAWRATIAASCTTSGERRRVCAICGAEEVEIIPPTGHAFGEWVVTLAPTDSSPGSRQRICTVCGYVEIEVLPPTVPPPPPSPPPAGIVAWYAKPHFKNPAAGKT